MGNWTGHYAPMVSNGQDLDHYQPTFTIITTSQIGWKPTSPGYIHQFSLKHILQIINHIHQVALKSMKNRCLNPRIGSPQTVWASGRRMISRSISMLPPVPAPVPPPTAKRISCRVCSVGRTWHSYGIYTKFIWDFFFPPPSVPCRHLHA